MLEPIQDNDNYKPHTKIIQIYPCLLKLSCKQESVTDGQTDRRTDGCYYYIRSPLSRGDKINIYKVHKLKTVTKAMNSLNNIHRYLSHNKACNYSTFDFLHTLI